MAVGSVVPTPAPVLVPLKPPYGSGLEEDITELPGMESFFQLLKKAGFSANLVSN